MILLGNTQAKGEDAPGRIVSLNNEEFRVLCELAATIEDTDGWHIQKGHVVKWSGQQVDLTKTLQLILMFAQKNEQLQDMIKELEVFRNKWFEEAEKEEPS